jgi:exonuclease I
MLELYRRALALRPSGSFAWRPAQDGVLAFDRDELTCIVNFAAEPIAIENVVLASDDVSNGLRPGTAAWTR